MAFVNSDGSEFVGSGFAPVVPAQATLLASTALAVAFGQEVQQVLIQNNTAAALTRSFSGAANAGSCAIAAGATEVVQVRCSAVSLFSTAGGTVNGNAAAGIVVEGYA